MNPTIPIQYEPVSPDPLAPHIEAACQPGLACSFTLEGYAAWCLGEMPDEVAERICGGRCG